MVSSSSLSRDQIKQQLIKTAQAHIARRGEMPVHREDKSKDLLINLEFKNGHPLILITMRADGITPEMIDWYQRDIYTHATKVDKAVIMKLLETESDGTTIAHQRIITPAIVSNRSIINALYEERRPDGSVLFMTSSLGNEELQKKYAKEIGKDEIAQCLLSYVEATPIKDASGKIVGSQIVWILNVDVAGALPDFIKQEIGKKQTEGLDMLIAYLLKNYKA